MNRIIDIINNDSKFLRERIAWRKREIKKEFPYKTTTKKQANARRAEYRRTIVVEGLQVWENNRAISILKAFHKLTHPKTKPNE